MTFLAKFKGQCTICLDPIKVGQAIRTDYRIIPPSYVHEDCYADDLEPMEPLGQQCPNCHLTMPLTGQCDCGCSVPPEPLKDISDVWAENKD